LGVPPGSTYGDAAKAAMRREVHRFVWLHCRTYFEEQRQLELLCRGLDAATTFGGFHQ
jgi:hypothetical protein